MWGLAKEVSMRCWRGGGEERKGGDERWVRYIVIKRNITSIPSPCLHKDGLKVDDAITEWRAVSEASSSPLLHPHDLLK